MNTATTERDHLPREVAIENLTDPKRKLSRSFRKTCMGALATVMESKHTIQAIHEKGKKTQYVYTQSARDNNFAAKVARKFSGLNVRQLDNISRRTTAGLNACAAALKQENRKPAGRRRTGLVNLLENKMRVFTLQRDAAIAVAKSRGSLSLSMPEITIGGLL